MVTAAVQLKIKSSIIWNLPGLLCAYCCLNWNHHYQGFHVIQVPWEQILAQIIFIFHIFHLFVFNIYPLALKTLRTRSYVACQVRKTSGRDSFSYEELRVLPLISGFFHPAAKSGSRSFVLLMVGTRPVLPPVRGTAHCLSSRKWAFFPLYPRPVLQGKGGMLDAALIAERTVSGWLASKQKPEYSSASASHSPASQFPPSHTIFLAG